MEFTYETQGTNTYLVYSVKENESIDTMSLGMITNNKIHGLAQTVFMQMDSNKFIKYNVSSKVSASQLFSGVVNKKRLIGVFTGIVDALIAAEDYMLDSNSILLDMDYIFADVSTCETSLICLPISDLPPHNTDVGVFFKNLTYGTQFDQTENCDHVARIINFLNSNPVVSLYEFKKLLEDLSKQTVNPVITNVANARKIERPIATPEKEQQPIKKIDNEIKQQKAPVAQAERKEPVKTIPNTLGNVPTSGMNIPGSAPQSTPQSQQSDEPEMSFMYLMQHFSKENLAAYKARKGKKDKSANMAPPAPSNYAKPGPAVPPPPAGVGFAIPGQAPSVAPQTPAPSAPQPPVPPAPNFENKPNVPPAPVQPQVKTVPNNLFPQGTIQSRPMDFGDTVLIGNDDDGATILLDGGNNAANVPNPHLVRAKNNEKIFLTNDFFKIGKEKGYADYCITDNSTISRSHAAIVTRNGEYFVIDTNSTNHTFVNNVMIQSNTETKINHGDNVRFSNEDFEFKAY